MNQSEHINELAAALAKAQGAFATIKASETAKIPTKSGKEYSYNYATLGATLEAVRKPLLDNGLAIAQFPETGDRQLVLTTRILHASGQWLESVMSIAVTDNDAKAIGSAITYLRRYALMAMLALGTEDDDGTSAGNVEPSRKPAPAVSDVPWYDGKTKGVAAWLKDKYDLSINDLHAQDIHLRQFKTREEFIEWCASECPTLQLMKDVVTEGESAEQPELVEA